MKAVLTVIVLLVWVSANAQENEHLNGKSDDNKSNEINKVSELVATSVLAVEIYPNPSDGNFFVKGKEGSSVTVYSLSGIYVGTWVIGNEEKVAITDLPEGNYLCSISNGETRILKRFVVL